MNLAVVLPVRNDWVSLTVLLTRLRNLGGAFSAAEVVVVDDHSEKTWSDESVDLNFGPVHVLRLEQNNGHQSAIFVGLQHVEAHLRPDAVVVMDADGEDTPDGALGLVRAMPQDPGAIIVASRGRRNESPSFRVGYYVYRLFFRVLTGRSLSFGNFMLVPSVHLRTLVELETTRTHLAASVLKSGLPIKRMVIDRGSRIDGKSRMNFEALILHGLRALGVFLERIALRVIAAAIAVSSGLILLASSLIVIRLATDRAVTGWTSTLLALSAVVFVQVISLVLSMMFSLLVLLRDRGRSALR